MATSDEVQLVRLYTLGVIVLGCRVHASFGTIFGFNHKWDRIGFASPQIAQKSTPVTSQTYYVPNSEPADLRKHPPIRYAGARLLELFFNPSQDPCLGKSGLEGTCYNSFDCSRRKGIADGPCATGGPGVCCVFMVKCNEAVVQNGTYFINRNYPEPDTSADVCQATIDTKENICQLRLDFIAFRLKGPEAGTCSEDRFIVSGLGASRGIPTICGMNDGQHLYIDSREASKQVTMNVLLLNKSDRLWVIRVTEISCNSAFKAPDDCLQFFTGFTGYISSFNYNTASHEGQYFNNLDYAICLRKEKGHCSVTYKNRDNFQVLNIGSHKYGYSSTTLTTSKGAAGAGIFQCPDDYIVLTGGLRLCGEKLNDGSQYTNSCMNGPVIGYYFPERLDLRATATNGGVAPNAEAVKQQNGDGTYAWKTDHPKLSKVRQMCNDPAGIKVLEEGLHPPDYQLKGIAVVTRHGERSPEIAFRGLDTFNCSLPPSSAYATDLKAFLSTASELDKAEEPSIPARFRRPRIVSRDGSCRPWAITQTGAVQASLNGRAISDAFLDAGVERLKRISPSDDVYIASTAYSRTVESALAFWSGFESNHPKMNVTNGRWPEMGIVDNVAFCFRRCSCRRGDVLRRTEDRARAAFFREHPAVARLTKEVSRIVYDEKGQKRAKWPSDLLESLVLWFCHDRPFPCTQDAETGARACVKPQNIASLFSYENRADDLKDELRMALKGYGLAEEIVRLAKEKIFVEQKKLVLFSGHDYTVEYLLSFFGLKKDLPPVPFSARLVIELYENSKDPLDQRFRAIYNGKDKTSRVSFCASNDAKGGSELLDVQEEARIWQAVRDPDGPGVDKEPGQGLPFWSMCRFAALDEFVQSGFVRGLKAKSFEAACRLPVEKKI
ncbi:unnamed protein product [Notodromas monacha]|uniref:CUB domain-containing protein n=1 Tax=Notodromas monacha TaxID=399045 RepID=A0A7R9BH89_9CRUS|nr:unnamed protein product [Notodromas monacha]CAG0914760.1 unnamed protein product [Notodromas monacha]